MPLSFYRDDTLAALEAFWDKVAVPAPFFPALTRPYAAFLGNPSFFTPRRDYLNFFDWDYFYETKPLRRTLEELVDLETLRDKQIASGLSPTTPG